MKYMNYFLQKNLTVGAIIKKNDVGFDEFEVVTLVGEWATIRSIYSEKEEILPIHTLCDEFKYFYTRKEVKVAGDRK